MVGELKEEGAGVSSATITWKVKPYLEGKWEYTHRQRTYLRGFPHEWCHV